MESKKMIFGIAKLILKSLYQKKTDKHKCPYRYINNFLPDSNGFCSLFLFLPFQDRLVWYCCGIWSREEDQPTQCPVSHCQRRRPSGSHAQDQVLANPKYDHVLL